MGEDTAQIGDVIDGRYRITGVLGSGGMSSVFRAEHITIRKPIAIKLLHTAISSDPNFGKRFEREAFVTGKTNHPNCVTVSDFGQLENGRFYLVMELVEGELLGELLSTEGPMKWPRALRIARHVLRGLEHAHQSDIVHRDIKPDNIILVDQDGDKDFAKILDFGIAKIIGPTNSDEYVEELTRAGTTVGTPSFVAPEQALGESVDGRADLYSLAVVLFYLLTGQKPFKSHDVIEVLALHVRGRIPAFADVAPSRSIPKHVEQIVRKGMAKEPKKRFANAAAFIAAIDKALEEPDAAVSNATAQVSSLPDPAAVVGLPGTPPPQQAWSKQKLGLIVGGAVLFVIIATLLARGGDGNAGSGPPVMNNPSLQGSAGSSGSDTDNHADKARELIDGGDAKGAIRYLESVNIEDNAAAQVQLGHAHSHKSNGIKALDAYAKAIQIDGDWRNDETLRRNSGLLLKAGGPTLTIRTLEFLIDSLEAEGAEDRLVALVVDDKHMAMRRHARKLAIERAFIDDDDLFVSYKLDLRQGDTCAERKKAVGPLKALGDRRAIAELKKAINRKGQGRFAAMAQKKLNGCLSRAARDAIIYLEQL